MIINPEPEILDAEWSAWCDRLCLDVPRDEPAARIYNRLMTTGVSFWTEADRVLYTQITGRTMGRLTVLK